jgi:protein associated with RNAse G/E
MLDTIVNLRKVNNNKQISAGKHNGILYREVNKISVVTAIKWL